MVNTVSKASFQSLPGDLLSYTLTFLPPQEVALLERTCRTWKRTIGSEEQALWKEICDRDKIPAEKMVAKELLQSVLGSHKSDSGVFSSDVLECIAGYAVSYKEHASFLRADLVFYWASMHLADRSRLGKWCFSDCHWGDVNEPYACIRLGDLVEQRKLHPTLKKEFPSFVPLRLLMDKEGNYRKEGDQVRVIFKTQRLVLTCKHFEHVCDRRIIESWQESITERVRISLACRFISEATLQAAQALAKKAPEWTNADYREPAPAAGR